MIELIFSQLKNLHWGSLDTGSVQVLLNVFMGIATILITAISVKCRWTATAKSIVVVIVATICAVLQLGAQGMLDGAHLVKSIVLIVTFSQALYQSRLIKDFADRLENCEPFTLHSLMKSLMQPRSAEDFPTPPIAATQARVPESVLKPISGQEAPVTSDTITTEFAAPPSLAANPNLDEIERFRASLETSGLSDAEKERFIESYAAQLAGGGRK